MFQSNGKKTKKKKKSETNLLVIPFTLSEVKISFHPIAKNNYTHHNMVSGRESPLMGW